MLAACCVLAPHEPQNPAPSCSGAPHAPQNLLMIDLLVGCVPLEAGDETTLVPIELPPRDGRAHTVEAALCHWACVAEALRLARGTEVT